MKYKQLKTVLYGFDSCAGKREKNHFLPALHPWFVIKSLDGHIKLATLICYPYLVVLPSYSIYIYPLRTG